MRFAPPIDDMLEAEWMRQVVQLARTLGWTRIYHTFNSRRSAHGFPDLVLVRERVVYLELKRERGKLTADQAGWLLALLDANVEAYVVRPRDLEVLAKVLAARERAGAERESCWLEGDTRAEAERRAA